MDTKWRNSLLTLLGVVLLTVSISTMFQLVQTRGDYFKKNYFYTDQYANQVQRFINYLNQMEFNVDSAEQVKNNITVTQEEIDHYRSQSGSLTDQVTGIKEQYEQQIQDARVSGNDELETFFTKEMNAHITEVTASFASDEPIRAKLIKAKEQQVDRYFRELENYRSDYNHFRASFAYKLTETATGKVFTSLSSFDNAGLKRSDMRYVHTYGQMTASEPAVYTSSGYDQELITLNLGSFKGEIGVPESAQANSPVMSSFNRYHNEQIIYFVYTGLGVMALVVFILLLRRGLLQLPITEPVTSRISPYYNSIPLDLRALLLLLTGIPALIHLQWVPISNVYGYGGHYGEIIHRLINYLGISSLLVLLVVIQTHMLIQRYRQGNAFSIDLRKTVIYWTYERLKEAALIRSVAFQAVFVLAVAFGAGIGFVIVSIYHEAILIYAVLLLFFAVPAIGLTLKRISYFNRIVSHTALVVGGNLEGNLAVKGNSPLASLAADINLLKNGVRASRKEQAKSERLKTELITNVSHDLRTPLTSIITYTELLKNKELREEDRQAYVDILDRKSQRLKVLIDDLFEASKMASGQVVLQKDWVDVVQLLDQALAEYDESIKQSGLQLRVTTPDHPVKVRVDGQKLWRTFDNLIGNCVKYALENTRVYITVAAAEERTVITFKNVTKYELSENIDELFERFKRGDASRHTEGSGLGLAIAKSIIDLHGGELDLEIDGDLFKVTITLEEGRQEPTLS